MLYLNPVLRMAMAMAALAGAAISLRAQEATPVSASLTSPSGETLRVNVANLSDPATPPDSCNVQVNFVNADGLTVKTTVNINVNNGQFGWANINHLEASRGRATANLDSQLGGAGANGPSGSVFSLNTTATRGTTISDTDTHMFYLVDNSGGTRNSAGGGVSNGNPQTFTLPHANVPGRVVVLIATCRNRNSSNVCNDPTDPNTEVINGSQIIANTQSGDTIVTNILALFTDGNHHWYAFDMAN